MSKVEKIILIVALAMLPVGIILAVIGFRFAGTKGWAVDLETMQYADNGNIIEKTVDLEEFDELKIDMDATDMTVTAGDAYRIHYRVPESREPEIRQDGKTLTITHPEKRNVMMFNFDTEDEVIELTVPANDKKYALDFKASSGRYIFDHVALEGQIKLTSGELKLSDFDASDLNVEISSGEVYAERINLDKLSAKQTSGDFTINDAKIKDLRLEASSGDYALKNVNADSVFCQLSSGKMNMEGVEADQIDGKMTSGTFHMDLIGNAEDYDYDISMTSGDLDLDGEDLEHQYKVEKGRDKKITMKATSGDIEIDFR